LALVALAVNETVPVLSVLTVGVITRFVGMILMGGATLRPPSLGFEQLLNTVTSDPNNNNCKNLITWS
jgi:hypothetical protein